MKTISRQRGVALLLVMWLVALLAALVGAFALIARTEHLQGRVLVRGLVAENAARAGIEYAMTRVAAPDPRQRWLPDGRPHRWHYDDADVVVEIVDENGKIDLNQADLTLLTEFIRHLGVEQQQATQLAAAIIDWRDPDSLSQPIGGGEDDDYAAAGLPYGAKDAEFESVAELEQVLGMTTKLYAKMAPHLTVFSGRGRPDPAFASAEVLDAMGMDGPALVAQREGWNPASGLPAPTLPDGGSLVGGSSGTYSIESRAVLADRRQAVLRAVVRAGGAMPGAAYTPLRWQAGD
ncbi:general secretion pathway protein K [Lysobacter niabensis]|uniref:Type II secretion system protein K n=1 Tax=Agrilutibacter niabensis TaxID=380628 RepID=A0ABU1VJN3_9GAMM|nr:general secretion pathway protein K [Lysobacter niabensis]